MFLKLLNYEEKIAFLALARQMIHADDVIHEGEFDKLDTMVVEMEIDVPKELDQRNVTELSASFTTPRSRVVCLLELIAIACSDGDYAIEEKALSDELAAKWNIESGMVDAYTAWVNEFMEVSNKGYSYIMGAGGH